MSIAANEPQKSRFTEIAGHAAAWAVTVTLAYMYGTHRPGRAVRGDETNLLWRWQHRKKFSKNKMEKTVKVGNDIYSSEDAGKFVVQALYDGQWNTEANGEFDTEAEAIEAMNALIALGEGWDADNTRVVQISE